MTAELASPPDHNEWVRMLRLLSLNALQECPACHCELAQGTVSEWGLWGQQR